MYTTSIAAMTERERQLKYMFGINRGIVVNDNVIVPRNLIYSGREKYYEWSEYVQCIKFNACNNKTKQRYYVFCIDQLPWAPIVFGADLEKTQVLAKLVLSKYL